jgi:hypothetical protein
MRLLLRLCLATSLAVLVGCPQNTGDTTMDVTVQYPAGLASRCVKVVTTGNGVTKETTGTPIDGAEGSVKISVPKGELPTAVAMKAVGHDSDCSAITAPAEESGAVRAGFSTPPASITLVMTKASAADGDQDGYSPPEDCNDDNARVNPGAAETCSDALDNDCDGTLDCADSSCDLGTCGSGALCMNARCTETSCNDRVDGDRDDSVDCADSDCDGKNCGGAGAICATGRCTETLCTNGNDDDLDGQGDCADSDCAGATCGTGGVCTANADGGPSRCLEPNETVCTDSADNDGDTLVDCADPDCNTRACNDMNACTTGETCAAANCTGGTATTCNTPPGNCYTASGTCEPSSGTCMYAPLAPNDPCTDGDACTSGDVCNGSGACAGQAVMCAAPPSQCFSMGTCQASLGGSCAFTVMTGATCNDGNNCTVGDTCSPDGGCSAGTPSVCTPPECRTFTGACDLGGACQFSNATASTPCDGGLCNSSGACIATVIDAGVDAGVDAGLDAGFDAGVDAGFDAGAPIDAGTFPFTPDNVVLANHPATGAFVVNCAQTLTTGPSAAFGTACPGSPNPTITIADGGAAGELAVVSVTSLHITDAGSLTITGSRPVVFLVRGDANVSGQVLANSSRTATRVGPGAAAPLTCGTRSGGAGTASGGRGGGGGGAGYFSNGGLGGGGNNTGSSGGSAGQLAMNGDAPLFAGCPGGTGSTDTGTTAGGRGGGALQLSVAGTLTLNAILTASGAGGTGATGGGDPGGGGGGSGGAINVQANRVLFTAAARVTSNGGGGGGGARDGTGGGGTDGANATATVAAGGTGDNGGGAGGAGGAGATNPVNGTTAGRGGGGAGGAAGRIFLKHYDSGTACSINGGAIISPAAARTNCP